MHEKSRRNRANTALARAAVFTVIIATMLALTACGSGATGTEFDGGVNHGIKAETPPTHQQHTADNQADLPTENANNTTGQAEQSNAADGQTDPSTENTNGQGEQSNPNNSQNNDPPNETSSTEETPTQDDRLISGDLPGFTPPDMTLEDIAALAPSRHAEMGVTARFVRTQDYAPEFVNEFSITSLVVSVAPNTAGSEAGLAVGDIILTVQGEPLARPLPQFADMVIGMEVYLSPIPGADIVLRILRNGVEFELTLFIA